MAQLAAIPNAIAPTPAAPVPSRHVATLHRLELLYVFVSLTIIGNAFQEYVPFQAWNLIRLSLYLVVTGVVALNLRTIIPVLIRSPFVTLLTVLAVVSYFWSAVPSATFSRSYPLVMNTLFAAYFATRFTMREQIGILARVVALFAALSLVFVLVAPEATSGSAWQGIFTQKNVYGRVMALGALLMLSLPSSSASTMRMKWFGYCAMLVFVFMSDSMTSLIIVLAITMLSFVLRAFWFGSVLGAALVFATAVPVLVFAYGAVTIDTDAVLISLGKDPSLTGRTEVWDKVQYAINETPMLGYGYGAFWNRWEGVYGTLWSRRDQFQPGSAHNTFLDVWVNVGILGPVLYLLSMGHALLLALKKLLRTHNGEGLWPVMYLTYLSILGLSEDFVLINGLYWTLYLVVVFSLAGVTRPRVRSVPAPTLSQRTAPAALAPATAK